MPEKRLTRDEWLAEMLATAEPAWTHPEGAYGNVYIRPMTFAHIGSVIEGHKHNFDHVTMLWAGAVRAMATLPNGKKVDKVFQARADHGPTFLKIPKETEHEFIALAPNTIAFCIYAHRDAVTGEPVEKMNGWMEAVT